MYKKPTQSQYLQGVSKDSLQLTRQSIIRYQYQFSEQEVQTFLFDCRIDNTDQSVWREVNLILCVQPETGLMLDEVFTSGKTQHSGMWGLQG